MVLRDPTVDVAVLETARGGILREGLGFDDCDVGAVLNVTADHLGLKGINTLEDLAAVKSVVVETVVATRRQRAQRRRSAHPAHGAPRRRRIVYFSLHGGEDMPGVLQAQRRGAAVVREPGPAGDEIVIHEGGTTTRLMPGRSPRDPGRAGDLQRGERPGRRGDGPRSACSRRRSATALRASAPRSSRPPVA